MNAAPATALPERQRRLLALMGIEVYVRRGAASTPATEPVVPAEPRAAPPADAAAPAPAAPRLYLRLDGNVRALLERHRRLVDHLLVSLGLPRDSVRIGQDPASAAVPLLCLGVAPGDRPDAIVGPPLAALATSGAAKAGLWRELRRLRPELERG